VIDTFLFSRLAHPIIASASSQNDFLNTITVGLLDVLAVALLLLALATYFFYSRTRRQSTQARGSTPRRAQRNVSTIASIMLAVPVAWLLVVWVGTSAGQLTPTPTAKPGKMTPTPKPNPAVTLASELVAPGTLTVGSVTNNPPQEYLDATSKPIGFDIDLIKAVAQGMHLQTHIMSASNFQALFDGLTNKQFDVAISAVSMTPALSLRFDFVPYFKTSESLLVQVGNPKHIKQLTDLCGLTVGVQAGSTELTELQQATCPAGEMIIPLPETSEANVIQLLQQRMTDAIYLDTPSANYYIGLKQNQGKFEVAATMSGILEEGIMIRKGDAVMLNAVMSAFNKLKHDGTYGSLIRKWSLTNEAIAEIDRRSWSIA
jgi:polar amino acid transport system substrate-binding protein